MQKIKVRLTFTESLLGSLSNNSEILAEYIASKAPTPERKAEEVVAIAQTAVDTEEPTVEEALQKQTTVFPRTPEGYCHVYDYQCRGFLKESLTVGIELGEKAVGKLSKWKIKSTVDSMVFVPERRILLRQPNGDPITKVGINVRPLRATTMQGDRVCIARSEEVPAGTWAEFHIAWLENNNTKSAQKVTLEAITWALDYGALKGLGQWRGGGNGRFSYVIIDESAEPAKAA